MISTLIVGSCGFGGSENDDAARERGTVTEAGSTQNRSRVEQPSELAFEATEEQSRETSGIIDPRYGDVTPHSAPGHAYSTLTPLAPWTAVTLIGEAVTTPDGRWVQLELGEYDGWVVAHAVLDPDDPKLALFVTAEEQALKELALQEQAFQEAALEEQDAGLAPQTLVESAGETPLAAQAATPSAVPDAAGFDT